MLQLEMVQKSPLAVTEQDLESIASGSTDGYTNDNKLLQSTVLHSADITMKGAMKEAVVSDEQEQSDNRQLLDVIDLADLALSVHEAGQSYIIPSGISEHMFTPSLTNPSIPLGADNGGGVIH